MCYVNVQYVLGALCTCPPPLSHRYWKYLELDVSYVHVFNVYVEVGILLHIEVR